MQAGHNNYAENGIEYYNDWLEKLDSQKGGLCQRAWFQEEASRLFSMRT